MKIVDFIKIATGSHIAKDNIESILDLANVSVYLKDRKGKYLGFNTKCLKITGLLSEDDVIGQYDRDLVWREQAYILEENDQRAIHTQQPQSVIEPCYCFDSNHLERFLSHKFALKSRTGKIIGTFGISILLDREDLIPKQNMLTKRQHECLYYLAKGMTMKEIASELKLSPKTIEHYLETVKQKLNCHNRAELIAKALQMQDINIKDRL